MHDFRLFKEHQINPDLLRLVARMKAVIIWGDSAYEALCKYQPDWLCQIHEKVRRNQPLSDQQKRNNRLKSEVRILVEQVIGRIKTYHCCADRGRNLSATRQSLYWNVVAGLCNLQQAQNLGLAPVLGYD